MNTPTTATVTLDKLNLNPLNPRRIFNERALVSSLVDMGLEVPIHIRGFKDRKTFDLLRGDRRTKALKIVRKEYPDAFEKHFAKGIPCIIHMDISDEEAIEITNDHGQTLSLSNEFEIYLTVEGYFRVGLSERQALFRIQTLLDHVMPIKTKAGAELKELKEKLENASKSTLAERVKEYEERYFKARRGVMQRYSRIYKNPPIVKDAVEYKWLKTMPEGYEEGSELPFLTDTDLRILSKTFIDEVNEGTTGEGAPVISKNNPGPKWNEKWADTVRAKSVSDDKKDGPRKSMSRADIVKPLEDGQLDSKYMVDVVRYHGADKEVDGKAVLVADQLLAVVEVVQKKDPDLWSDCVDVYKAYLEEQRNSAIPTAE
jgi:hypothetical protein